MEIGSAFLAVIIDIGYLAFIFIADTKTVLPYITRLALYHKLAFFVN